MNELMLPPDAKILVPAPLGISGRVNVMKYGRDRQRIPVRIDRNRRTFQRVWNHEQSNLILDSGLNYGMSYAAPMGFAFIHNYIAVGTGSAEPAVNQTALVSELARTNGSLTFGAGDSYPATTEVGLGKFMRRRAFDFGAANGNLTEFGGTDGSATNMRTRSLFRDEFGDPVTITKTSDEQLVIEYTIYISCSPTVATAGGSVFIDGVGTLDYEHAFAERMLTYADSREAYYGVAWNTGSDGLAVYVSDVNMSYSNLTAGTLKGSTTWQSYTDNTFYRDGSVLISAGTTDYTIYGYGLAHAYGLSLSAAHKIRFLTTFFKSRDYRLSVGARYSIARTGEESS
jgi:hypothetical protein